jgi:ABC-type multidrug transport system fused ATPase/permease subunit
MDEDEKQARATKIDYDILKTTFGYIGGTGLIATFVFTNFLSQLVSTFSGFYEKDFFVQDEEKQREQLFTFIRNVLLVQLFKLVIELVRRVFVEYKNRITLDHIYSSLFTKMVNAPINEFYDVTPTFTIVQRFQACVDCFQSSIIESILRIFSSLSDFLIKMSIFYSVSGWLSAICLVAAYQLVLNQIKWRVVVNKFYSFENFLKRNDVSTYQTYAGGPLIKCFGMQQHFIDKKRNFIDTREQINLIHRSGNSYSEMRSEVIQSLFFAVACFTIIGKKGVVSPVILSTIFFDSMTIAWMTNTVWGYDWLVDNLEKAKWAITMQNICPQEKQTAEV